MKSRSLIAPLAAFLLLARPAGAAAEPDRDGSEALIAQADSIARRVSRLRSLALRAPLARGLRDRDGLRASILEALARDYTDAEIADEAAALTALGLLPERTDYKRLLVDLLTDQIAGFYDQHARELYLMRGLPAEIQRPTMAHEIVHALQDQHFGILSLQGPPSFSKRHGDFALARSALLEGDATVLMLDFTLYEQGTLPAGEGPQRADSIAEMPAIVGAIKNLKPADLAALGELSAAPGEAPRGALQDAPPFVRESLLFPYLAGVRFALIARQRAGSWEAFDAVYERPPVSTEQILHPERYFDPDPPILLSFDAASALPGWAPIYDNTLGEFGLHLALRAQLGTPPPPSVDVDDAAEGWGGDRVRAWRGPDGRIVAAHLSVWDSVSEARAYFKAAASAQRARLGPEARAWERAAGHGASLCLEAGARRIYLERWGDLVLIVHNVPSDDPGLAARIRDAVFATAERAPFIPPPRSPRTSAPPKRAPRAR